MVSYGNLITKVHDWWNALVDGVKGNAEMRVWSGGREGLPMRECGATEEFGCIFPGAMWQWVKILLWVVRGFDLTPSSKKVRIKLPNLWYREHYENVPFMLICVSSFCGWTAHATFCWNYLFRKVFTQLFHPLPNISWNTGPIGYNDSPW